MPLGPLAVDDRDDLTLLSLEELRALRQNLTKLEGQVSYWRRIIQARLDLMRDGSLKRGATVEGLQRVLSQHLGNPNRKMLMSVQPGEAVQPALAGLAHLWHRGIKSSAEADDQLEVDLSEAEARLSAERAQLHRRIDATTAELVARYRAQPELALTALPSRAPRHTPL